MEKRGSEEKQTKPSLQCTRARASYPTLSCPTQLILSLLPVAPPPPPPHHHHPPPQHHHPPPQHHQHQAPTARVDDAPPPTQTVSQAWKRPQPPPPPPQNSSPLDTIPVRESPARQLPISHNSAFRPIHPAPLPPPSSSPTAAAAPAPKHTLPTPPLHLQYHDSPEPTLLPAHAQPSAETEAVYFSASQVMAHSPMAILRQTHLPPPKLASPQLRLAGAPAQTAPLPSSSPVRLSITTTVHNPPTPTNLSKPVSPPQATLPQTSPPQTTLPQTTLPQTSLPLTSPASGTAAKRALYEEQTQSISLASPPQSAGLPQSQSQSQTSSDKKPPLLLIQPQAQPSLQLQRGRESNLERWKARKKTIEAARRSQSVDSDKHPLGSLPPNNDVYPVHSEPRSSAFLGPQSPARRSAEASRHVVVQPASQPASHTASHAASHTASRSPDGSPRPMMRIQTSFPAPRQDRHPSPSRSWHIAGGSGSLWRDRSPYSPPLSSSVSITGRPTFQSRGWRKSTA